MNANKFQELIKPVLEDLDPSDDVRVDGDSLATITFEDGSTYKFGPIDSQKVFQSVETVEKMSKLIDDVDETAISISNIGLPDDVFFELEDVFSEVEEL